MNKLILLALSVVFLMVGGFEAFAQEAIKLKRQPNSARECAICHYEMMDVFVYDNASTEIADYPTSKLVSSEKMCFSCHDGSVSDSRMKVWDATGTAHKTGVELKPEMKAISVLPLIDNKVTCMTCHTAHGEGNSGLEGIHNSLFLRISNDESALCKSCHDSKTKGNNHFGDFLDEAEIENIKSKNGRVTSKKMVTCMSCHEAHGSKNNKLTIDNAANMSLCKNCHDDFFAGDSSNKLKRTPHVMTDKILNDNMSKAILQSGGQLGEEGTLVCFSCHKVHDASFNFLLNRDSRDASFCTTCHDGYQKVLDTSHNLTKKPEFITYDKKSISEVGVCGACHSGHSFRLPFKSTDAKDVSSICLNCHNDKGIAAKKSINDKMFNHYIGAIDVNKFKKTQYRNANDLKKSADNFLKSYFADPNSMAALFADKQITCITCHDIHDTSKMFVRAELKNGTLCVGCHSDKEQSVKGTHGQSKIDQSCVSCHSLHNSPDQTLVRNNDKNDGCLTCHGEQKSKELPRGMSVQMPKELMVKGYNHPTAIDNMTIFPEPMRTQSDGRFTCVSCHDPHAVQNDKNPMQRNFLRVSADMKDMGDFCIRCHENEKDVILSSHTIDPKKAAIVNKRTNRKASSCDNCHKTHNAETEKAIASVAAKYKTDDDLCVNCHNPKGDAKDKMIDKNKGHFVGVFKDKVTKADLVFLEKIDGKSALKCSTCHDPHKNGPKQGAEGDIGNSFLKKLDASQSICLSCHTEQKNVKGGAHDAANFEDKSKENKKRVANKDLCSSCHDMHGGNPKFLMDGKTITDRCMQCHGKGESSKYTVISYHKPDVDVKDKSLFPLDNNKIACTTCHDPHNAAGMLVRVKSGRVDDQCSACHEANKAVMASKHNMALADIKDNDLKALARVNSCEPCHSAHNPKRSTSIQVGDTDSHVSIQESCLSCHKPNGAASAKTLENYRHSSIMKTLPLLQQFEKYTYDHTGRRSNKGDIECSTCHDPHVWSSDNSKVLQALVTPGGRIEGDNSTSFLKTNVSKEFCIVCHTEPEEWFNQFHSTEFRASKANWKRPDSLLERMFKVFGK